MFHINLIVLGKLKEKFWQEAEAEYLKRLQAWAKIAIHELREESFSEKDSPEHIKQKEAEKISAQLKKLSLEQSYIVVLDEHGKQFSSLDFAKHINQSSNQQINNFTFIIGGPLGLDQSILKLASLKLSLSSMTFTHQMARIFLLEQIYRAMTINNRRNYHY
jgi:23S rRNA (pseudouridine1915-N3)-methyltransferase